MRTILRTTLFYSVSLYLVTLFCRGLVITGGIVTYVETAAILTLVMMLIKPIIQIVSLPITVLTLGLFSFVINAGILFLVTKVVHGINIYPFMLQSFSYKTVSTPALSLNLLLACIFISFALSVLVTVLRLITK